MKNKNIKLLTKNLNKFLNNNKACEDKDKINYFCNELNKLSNIIPSKEKLEELHKIQIDLEVKYDELTEIANLFDPIYVSIKDEIYCDNIKKIREENKRKRENR